MVKKLLLLVPLVGVLVWWVRGNPAPDTSKEHVERSVELFAPSTESGGRPYTRWAVTERSPAPQSVVALERSTEPDIVALSVAAYQKQRTNVYFDGEEFVQDWLAMDEDLVKHLVESLENAPELVEPQSSFLDEQPAVALERMAHIDVLEQVAIANVTDESSAAARDALAHVIAEDLPRDLSAAQKRMMVGEKYDALNALARTSPEAAARVFTALDGDGKKQALKGALLSGLLDRGAKRAEVLADLDRLLASIE